MQHGKNLLAAGVLLSLTALNAQATLTTNANGLGVYDSGLNATWTQDANLLGTLEASDANLVSKIIAASGGVIHDTPNFFDNGTYTLTAADFGSGGTVDWWGAQAYVSYLNSLNNGAGYGGSSHWALPTQPDQNAGSNISNSQLGELYYNELNALAFPGSNGSNFGILGTGTFNDTSGSVGPFSNAHIYAYWSGTEYAALPRYAWHFVTYYGFQDISSKGYQFYAWAVSPGQVNAVPVPGAVWLFGTGMLGLLGLKRRGHAG